MLRQHFSVTGFLDKYYSIQTHYTFWEGLANGTAMCVDPEALLMDTFNVSHPNECLQTFLMLQAVRVGLLRAAAVGMRH